MKALLKLKHWQLFLLIVICGAWISPSPLQEIINSIAFITFGLWLYAIGVYGQEKIKALGLKPMNVKLFKANMLIVGLSILAAFIFSGNGETTITDSITWKDIPLIVLSLYVVFAMLQTVFFACKTLAKIESQGEVLFTDYLGSLFWLSFFLVGVWILQPKVNRIFAAGEVGLDV